MLHPARLSPQVRQAEADEECTTNKLLKRLMVLKQEKEQLAIEVEREEELLTNKLQRKLRDVRQEKVRAGRQRPRRAHDATCVAVRQKRNGGCLLGVCGGVGVEIRGLEEQREGLRVEQRVREIQVTECHRRRRSPPTVPFGCGSRSGSDLCRCACHH